jgi:hypothetical protein
LTRRIVVSVCFEFTDNPKAPSVIIKDEFSTPVWIQQEWTEGEFANYIVYNGCGHCCTAMVLNLLGVKIDPYEEYLHCRKMWGAPRQGEPLFEENYMSAVGIEKIIESFGIKAKAYGVEKGKTKAAAEHIMHELTCGKLVIFWSHPSDKLPDNPFSSGEHYVLLCGITDDGKILVANSSVRGKTDRGIQFADIETVEKALFEGSTINDYTWGRHDLAGGGAYVVAG